MKVKLSRSTSPLFVPASRPSDEQPPKKKKKFNAKHLRVQVTFEVGSELKDPANQGKASDSAALDLDIEDYNHSNLPEHILEFKHRLTFDNYGLRGKLADAEDGEVIQLPRLYPWTVFRFLELLNSRDGQKITFSKLENLILAFIFATAIEDSYLQQMTASRFYELSCPDQPTVDYDVRSTYKQILNILHWAWEGTSEARISLRPLLTMCFAWLSIKGSESSSRKSITNVIRLDALADLEKKNPNWEEGLLLEFARKCLRLREFNQGKKAGWEKVPVGELLPERCKTVIELD